MIPGGSPRPRIGDDAVGLLESSLKRTAELGAVFKKVARGVGVEDEEGGGLDTEGVSERRERAPPMRTPRVEEEWEASESEEVGGEVGDSVAHGGRVDEDEDAEDCWE